MKMVNLVKKWGAVFHYRDLESVIIDEVINFSK